MEVNHSLSAKDYNIRALTLGLNQVIPKHACPVMGQSVSSVPVRTPKVVQHWPWSVLGRVMPLDRFAMGTNGVATWGVFISMSHLEVLADRSSG